MIGVDKVPRTALEIYKQLPEGTRCEVIKNVLYMSPSPTRDHQKLLQQLLIKLEKHNNIGAEIIQSFDVYLEPQLSAFQPDISVVLKENLELVWENGIFGAPDVIVEVLSTYRD